MSSESDKNIYQIKLVNGEEVIAHLSLIQSDTTLPSKRELLSTPFLQANWTMMISTIVYMESEETERLDYIFKPWMLLQDDIDGEIFISTSNIISIYEPSVLIKGQYLEMVDKYHEYMKELKSMNSDKASDKPKTAGKIVSLFNQTTPEK